LNNWGQIGNGKRGDCLTPERIGTDNDWKNIAGGEYFSLALKSNGSLWSWGENNLGQLGLGSLSGSEVRPKEIVSDTKWKAFACGGNHAVAYKSQETNAEFEEETKNHISEVYPNPSSDNTSLLIAMKKKTDVSIILYNNIGQIVRLIYRGVLDEGKHDFVIDGSDMPTGTYTYRIFGDEIIDSGILILVK
jgi:hypothetical protein